MSAARNPVVLATGGTGGHVFPAQALAAELQRRGHAVAVLTDARGATFEAGVDTHRIRAATITRSVPGLAKGARDILLGTAQAWRLLRRLRPAAVVGFGGYSSVPTVLAASWLRVPTLLHEQNAVLGRANRFLAARVDRIATSFPEVQGVRTSDRGKLVRTGNPVRPAIATSGRPYAAPGSDQGVELLVLGGSQGARIFSDTIPDALAALPAHLRSRLHIVQQCRPEDLDRVRARYAEIGLAADLASFFADVPQRLAAAHLVIARSGASSVAEFLAAGRPALLVPYPFAMDDHQTANARAIDAAGGAWLMPQEAFSAQSLAARIESFLALPATLETAAAKASALAQPDAAARLADLVEDTIRSAEAPARAARIRSAAA